MIALNINYQINNNSNKPITNSIRIKHTRYRLRVARILQRLYDFDTGLNTAGITM